MDDEEAKRRKEEQDKELWEEYQRINNPQKPLDKLASIIPKVDPELVQHRLYGRTRQNS